MYWMAIKRFCPELRLKERIILYLIGKVLLPDTLDEDLTDLGKRLKKELKNR